jgi:hypothetical protein
MLWGGETAPLDGGANRTTTPLEEAMTSTTLSPARSAVTTRQKVGLVICGLYSLTNLPAAFLPPGTGEEDGPPFAILVIGSVLGLVGLVATVLAWRGDRVALRVAAGAIIVATLTALPAFFVDVPTVIKALTGVSVLITLVAVVLMFSTDRRSERVTD